MLACSKLENGIHVITQNKSESRSAALGVWLLNGARHQAADQSGYAHFLEHLIFRKTKRFSGKQLSGTFEAMGGQINAETGRELTAYYGLVPGEHAYELLDLFISMLTEPSFDEQDLNIEREVVLQELGMLFDDPEEALEDLGTELVWNSHPIGWQILGDSKTLSATTAEAMHAYLREVLNPVNIYVVATGNVDHEKLMEQCRALENLQPGTPSLITPPDFNRIRHHTNEDNEQTQLLWAMPAPSASADNYYHYVLANHLLADGVSSYLYQRVREELGLVYSLHSRIDAYSDAGLWLLQTNTQPDQVNKCIDAIQTAIEEWIDKGPSEQEIQQSRTHIRSSLILEDDDLEASMDRIAREFIYHGQVPGLEERLQKFENITATQLQATVKDAWDNHSFISMGKNSS